MTSNGLRNLESVALNFDTRMMGGKRSTMSMLVHRVLQKYLISHRQMYARPYVTFFDLPRGIFATLFGFGFEFSVNDN